MYYVSTKKKKIERTRLSEEITTLNVTVTQHRDLAPFLFCALFALRPFCSAPFLLWALFVLRPFSLRPFCSAPFLLRPYCPRPFCRAQMSCFGQLDAKDILMQACE